MHALKTVEKIFKPSRPNPDNARYPHIFFLEYPYGPNILYWNMTPD
jgi:hypothetical protein